ncbi:MAG: ATP-binding protein [Rikenellaceae bacterium]|nr:ATP-binding protein [Rikenellaceae bacterium]
MMIEEIIFKITGYPYSNIGDSLPTDCDRDEIPSTLEDIINSILSEGLPSEEPFLLNISGIPCSGKSSYCKKLLSGGNMVDEPVMEGSISVSFDAIMEHKRLPYINEICSDADRAYSRWEVPARIAGYELLRRAVGRRTNIIFEHSSSIPEHRELFRSLSDKGYKIHFRYIRISPEEALARLDKRGYRNPEKIKGYINERLERIESLLPEYEKICTTFKIIEQCHLY